MNKIKKIFVSCGEMSGDLHLSYLIKEIKKIDPKVEFHGVVGDKSIQEGAIKLNHIKENDVMGFVEALKKYKYFKKKSLEYITYIKDRDQYQIKIVILGNKCNTI